MKYDTWFSLQTKHHFRHIRKNKSQEHIALISTLLNLLTTDERRSTSHRTDPQSLT